MTEVTLVRHGQASFGSDNYDQLSELGHQQSQWLGQYYAERDIVFDRVIIGSQRRHRETAEGILLQLYSQHGRKAPEMEINSGLNEYDFQSLYQLFCQKTPSMGEQKIGDRKQFHSILHQALVAWSQQELIGELETWEEFHQRTASVIESLRSDSSSSSAPKQKVLIVSSGGAISMILGQTLQLSADKIIALNLQMINAAFSNVLVTPSNTHLLNFNNIPHLDSKDRPNSITYS